MLYLANNYGNKTKNRLAGTRTRHIHWLTSHMTWHFNVHSTFCFSYFIDRRTGILLIWNFCQLSLGSWHFCTSLLTRGEKTFDIQITNRQFLWRSSECLRNPIAVMNMNYISSALVTGTRRVLTEAWTFWRFGKYFLTRTQEGSNYLIKTFLWAN